MPNSELTDKDKKEIAEKLKQDIIAHALPASLESYTLMTYLTDNMEELKKIATGANMYKDVFKIKGFSSYMRAYHIKKLPILEAKSEVRMVNCPYCFNNVTLESCRIDHVIPVNIFTRYLVLNYVVEQVKNGATDLHAYKNDKKNKKLNESGVPSLSFNESEHYDSLSKESTEGDNEHLSKRGVLRNNFAKQRIIDRGNNEYFNLLLCCQACNSSKSNNLDIDKSLAISEIYARKNGNPILECKIKSIRMVLHKILKLKDHHLHYVMENKKATGLGPSFLFDPIKNFDKLPTKEFIPFYCSDAINKANMEESLSNPGEFLVPFKTITVGKRKTVKRRYSSLGINSPEINALEDLEKRKKTPEGGVQISTRSATGSQDITSLSEEDYNMRLITEYLLFYDNEITDNERAAFKEKKLIKSLEYFDNSLGKHPQGNGVDFSVVDYEISNKSTIEIESENLKDLIHAKVLFLKSQITTTGEQTFNGKLCLYCMGVYEEAAFELDHIKPASKISGTATIEKYNDLTNIVAVCKTCNTTKNSDYLSNNFLVGRFNKIRDINSPYYFLVEHVNKPNSFINYTLDEVLALRNKIFDGKIE